MRIALLTDFGSTHTKVAAVNLDGGHLVGQGLSRTTIETDILDGYEDAVKDALDDVEGRTNVEVELAASSAGGGLRIVAIGLVVDLTAKAAEMAALNAGARVEAVLNGELGDADLELLERVQPEIVLFAGGTDGGQRRRVLENAEIVASADIDTLVVVACNSEIAEEVKSRFEAAGHQATVVGNVMPEIGKLSVDLARAEINRLFLSHVIQGKHLSASRRFEQLVTMATPEAVLQATALLANSESLNQIGDAVIVSDVGGATTDMYSALVRRSIGSAGTAYKGLTVPSIRRTVQGDLGIRINATSVLRSDQAWLEKQLGDAGDLEGACARRSQDPTVLFEGGWDRDLDEKLAVACMYNGIRRHCGRHQVSPGVTGKPKQVQTPPDLRRAGTFIAGGGIIRESSSAEELVREALERQDDGVLAPRASRVVIDKRYVLAAAGLLSSSQAEVAYGLLTSELRLDR